MAQQEQLADLGKVEAIRRLFDSLPFRLREGHDFIGTSKGAVVTASRLFAEGTDFNLVYFPLQHLGYKCVLAVSGELQARLAHAKVLGVVIGLSAKLDFGMVKELWRGIAEAAREQGYEAVNLDLVPSQNGLYISVSATGETSELTRKRRPAPKSKDLLCVTGRLGAAYLGMQVLERGNREFEKTGKQPEGLDKYRMLIGAYLKPELAADTVARLEETEIYPTAGIFLRSGLADAAKRLALETGLGVKVYADKIPFEGNSFALGREMDIDPVSAALSGGDDCQLLFVVPILSLEKLRKEFPTFDIVGHLAEPAVGAVLVTPDGAELPIHAPGWPEE